jgi:hypothetical protein
MHGMFDLLLRSHFSWVLPLAVWVVSAMALWSSGKEGLPVGLSVALCALGAAIMAAAGVAAVWAAARLVLDDDDINKWALASMSAVVLISWAVATPLVLAFVRRRGAEEGLSRISSRLFLGTMLEAAAIIPLDVMIRRKTDCHCEEGTYWALAGCWAVGLFALGPVIFLVPLSKRRKRWYAGRCDACGYDMSGCLTADRCPECGAGWKPSAAS